MFCTQCSAQIEEGTRFCSNCAHPVISPNAFVTPATIPQEETPSRQSLVGKKYRGPIFAAIGAGLFFLPILFWPERFDVVHLFGFKPIGYTIADALDKLQMVFKYGGLGLFALGLVLLVVDVRGSSK
jgi:hypothetical protein